MTPVALRAVAGSGIGAASARKLRAQGWEVAISSSDMGEVRASKFGGLRRTL